MKTLLTTTALVALLGAAPVFAAEAPITDQPTANDVIPDPNATAPAAQPEATTPDSSAQPMDESAAPADNAAQPADKSQDQVQTPATDDATVAAAPADKFLTDQAEAEWMASSLIGSSVYNSADENLGDINDIVFNDSGAIDAVIIGVGGFLGIGEKSVAVSFASLEKTTDADGNIKFMLNVSKEELDAAPTFVTLAEKVAEKKKQEAQPPADPQLAPAPDDSMAPAAPAPAPEPAPAQ